MRIGWIWNALFIAGIDIKSGAVLVRMIMVLAALFLCPFLEIVKVL